MHQLTRPMWFKGVACEDTPPFKEGDMVYGKLLTKVERAESGFSRWIPHIITDAHGDDLLPNPLTVKVKPETVSEWTGMTDADDEFIYENDIISDGKTLFKVEYIKGAFRVVSLAEPIVEDYGKTYPRGIEADDQHFLLSEQLQSSRTNVMASVFSPSGLLEMVRS